MPVPKMKQPGSPWSDADLYHAIYLRGRGWTTLEIGVDVGRSADAVDKKLASVGIFAPPKEQVDGLEATHPQILTLEKQRDRLQEELSAAQEKLKVERRSSDIFEDLAERIRKETKPLPGVSVGRFVPSKSEDALSVDAVLLLSDEHADQVITAEGSWGLEQYDFNVCRARYQRLLKLTTGFLTKYLPKHSFERLHVFSLGDGVHGDIHNASGRTHFQNTIKAAVALGDMRAQFIRSLAEILPVHVVGVSGNHPRRTIRKDYDRGPHDNFDYLANVQVATRLHHLIEEGMVTVDLPNSWTAFAEVRGRVWALNHGDDVTGTWSIPWYGFERKNSRVQAMVRAKDVKIDVFAYGHFHTPVEFASAGSGATSLHNGAFPMTDPFAQNKVAAANEPVQRFAVVDSPHGNIMSVPIFLRDPLREKELHAGKWDPDLGRHTVLDAVASKQADGFRMIRHGR